MRCTEFPNSLTVIFLNPSNFGAPAQFLHQVFNSQHSTTEAKELKTPHCGTQQLLPRLRLIIITQSCNASPSRSFCGGLECLVSLLTISGRTTFCLSWCQSKPSLIITHKLKESFVILSGLYLLSSSQIFTSIFLHPRCHDWKLKGEVLYKF